MSEAGRIVRTALSVRRHSSGPAERIAKFQDRKVKQVVAHAYEMVPYYRQLLDRHGIAPSDVQSVADLAKIPVTTKSDVRGLDPSQLVSRDVDPTRLFERTTTGTTGEPFKILRTPREEFLLTAVFLRRELKELGVRRGDRVAMVKAPARGRGMTRKTREKPGSKTFRRILARRAGADRVSWINAFIPTKEILGALQEANPDVIAGYPGALSSVARLAESLGEKSLTPRLVITGAETITPLMREQISRVFRAPVYDTYGSHEVGRIATQCTRSNEYHICSDSVAIEIMDENGQVESGKAGRVIVTSLHSYAMPFIRFDLGDIAVRGGATCSCGAPYATLLGIKGRMMDNFILPDGSEQHPWILLDALWPHLIPWIAQYRFVQETVDRIVMFVIPRVPPNTGELHAIATTAQRILGSEVEFVCRIVEELEVEASDKSRPFRSLVRSAYA